MRRFVALSLIASLSGCGAHLHRPLDDQLARAAAARIDGLDWSEAFALDRDQRDRLAAREAMLGAAYADARREAELLEILTEPIGERSWTKLEQRFVELAACMLAEPGTGGGRACRGRIDEVQREVARALLFDACPAQGCAWIDAVFTLSSASASLAAQLASYDRARGLAALGEAVATPAQCPVPTKVPSALRSEREALEQACVAYAAALEALAAALPEGSGLRRSIVEYLELADTLDAYRRELRMLVAELSSLRFDGREDQPALARQVPRYLELQREFTRALASAAFGDFGDLALEGTSMITREHRAAIVRVLAELGVRIEVDRQTQPAETPEPTPEPTPEVPRDSSFRAGEEPPRPVGEEPPPGDPIPERDRSEDPPPRPIPESEPEPPRPIPEGQPPPSRPAPPLDAPPDTAFDRELIREFGEGLAPVFGETWATLLDQRRRAERGALLFSAELERIQIDAMTRRLGLAQDRLWLELASIETQAQALAIMRMRLDTDWIPAERPRTPAHDELDALQLELELARAARARAELEYAAALDKPQPSKSRTDASHEPLLRARARVLEAQAAVDAAADAYNEELAEHGPALCRRSGSVVQTHQREPACVAPIEGLVGLHAELVGAGLERLEQLDRDIARRVDEAALIRDEAGLQIRVTYIAASVTALQRFNAGGVEGRDIAAIVGAVVGIGLGAAIAAGVYIP
jgi:hypothetical protein